MIISNSTIELQFTEPDDGNVAPVVITETADNCFTILLPWSHPETGLLASTHDVTKQSHRDAVDTTGVALKEFTSDFFNTVRGLLKGLQFGLKWEDEDYMPFTGHDGSKFTVTNGNRTVIGFIGQMHLEVFLTNYRGAKLAFQSDIGNEFNMREGDLISILTDEKCGMDVDTDDPDDIPVIGSLCFQYLLHSRLQHCVTTIGTGTLPVCCRRGSCDFSHHK